MRLSLRVGITLIEIVIAAFVFAVGVLAVEAATASSLRRMARSAQLALAGTIARSRLEVLASSFCDDLRSGTDTVRSVISSWTIEATAARSIRAVSQTVTYDLDGARRTDSYRTMVRCGE